MRYNIKLTMNLQAQGVLKEKHSTQSIYNVTNGTLQKRTIKDRIIKTITCKHSYKKARADTSRDN